MEIYNGDILDTTNFRSNSFLQINSCGIQLPTKHQFATYRKRGRYDYHILYVTAGRCHVEYEGNSQLVRQGFVLYPPNVPQKYIDYEDTGRVWIHFTGNHMDEILADAQLSCGIHQNAHSPIAEKMMIQLIAEHNRINSGSHENGLLLSILYTLGQLTSHRDCAHDRINEAVTFITTHYNMELNIRELADSCSLSPSRFMCLFKEQTGKAPHAYQQKLRIENAMTLLTSTQLSISEICRLTGYQDPLYFSRVFRKNTGMSPSQYRDACSQ